MFYVRITISTVKSNKKCSEFYLKSKLLIENEFTTLIYSSKIVIRTIHVDACMHM